MATTAQLLKAQKNGAEMQPETEPASKCDCTPTWVGHMPGCPGDPSEWGAKDYTGKKIW